MGDEYELRWAWPRLIVLLFALAACFKLMLEKP